MPDGKNEQLGKQNEKMPDSDIQGRKGGQRNRAETEAGSMPPPAGETRQSPDPRSPDSKQGKQ